jgi:hypothetical protein
VCSGAQACRRKSFPQSVGSRAQTPPRSPSYTITSHHPPSNTSNTTLAPIHTTSRRLSPLAVPFIAYPCSPTPSLANCISISLLESSQVRFAAKTNSLWKVALPESSIIPPIQPLIATHAALPTIHCLEEMTPHSSAAGASQKSHTNKRSQAAPSRVAIPLPLSKPRAQKPQSQPTTDPAVDAPAKKELAAQIAKDNEVETPPAAQDGANASQPATNGLPDTIPDAEVEFAASATAGAALEDITVLPHVNGNPYGQPQGGPVRPLSPTMIVAHPQTKLSDAPSQRKPSHIRTELPPAFVPSAGQHTPHSSTFSRQPNQMPQSFQPQVHSSRPSTSGIVFGDVDSSESSPAPPQSSGSSFAPPLQQMPRHFQPPPFAPINHAHHFSEPQAYPVFPGGYVTPQHWNPQRGYYPAQQHPPFLAQPQQQYRYPAQDGFTPIETTQPNMPSALSRSASPGSAYAEALRSGQDLRSPTAMEKAGGMKTFAEPRHPFSNQAPIRQPPFARQLPPQQQSVPPPEFRLDMDNAQMLRDHVRSQFSKPALTDCCLQISHDSDASTQRIDAHKLILARSPTLLRLIQNSGDAHKPQLDVHLPGRYLSLHTFNECLKYIYGGQLPPLDPTHRPSPSFTEPLSAQVDRMEQALQRVATGAWLEMPAIAWQGLNVATNTMTWDTLPTALEFGLDGGISPKWTLDDGSEERGSATSSDDSHARPDAGSSTPTYDPFATPLLQSIFQFVSNSFPLDFYPDTSAPQLKICPRLPPLPPKQPPQHKKNEHSRSTDPRLSQIRFGELPSEGANAPRPSPVTTTISSLLFSLPFALLKFLLEHPVLAERVGPETVGSIMRQTILERESRRLRCLNAKSTAAGARQGEPGEVTNLYWEESVEATGQGRLGLRLCRRRKDVETPASSDSVSNA